MTSCLLPFTKSLFKLGSTLKGENLLKGSQFSPLRIDPVEKEQQ